MSKAYKQWICEQPCAVTGREGEGLQAHHIVGYAHITGKCMGKKASDLMCIPLYHEEHKALHDKGFETYELENNFSQPEALIKILLEAEKQGIIKVK